MKSSAKDFQHHPEGTITSAHFGRATRELSNYMVSFSLDDNPAGSGTLVTLGPKFGFLTAAHVADHLWKSPTSHVGIVCSDRASRLYVDRNHMDVIGRTRGGDDFPDFAFIELLDTRALGALKAIKSFYPFTNPSSPQWDRLEPKNATVCFFAGAPAEQATSSGDRAAGTHILTLAHLFGRLQLTDSYERDGFEYLVFICFAGIHGFPETFGGVSGGGVWHVPFAMNPDKGPDSITNLRAELLGFAIQQRELVDQSRQLVVQGYKGVHQKLIARLPASIPKATNGL